MSKQCGVCSELNNDAALICSGCGMPFDNISAELSIGKPKIVFRNIVTGVPIEIPEDGCIIGRDSGHAQELFNHKWVSDPHCKISIIDNECYIEDIGSSGTGSTNGTFLDGNKLPARTPAKFYDGSRIKIAHLMFDTEISYPQTAFETSERQVDETKYIWVIDCPGSGKRYTVDDELSSIPECDCCEDSVDRLKISKVKPKQVRA